MQLVITPPVYKAKIIVRFTRQSEKVISKRRGIHITIMKMWFCVGVKTDQITPHLVNINMVQEVKADTNLAFNKTPFTNQKAKYINTVGLQTTNYKPKAKRK